MSEAQCGNCDHYHYLVEGKVDCFVDGKLHETIYRCDDYKRRITSKPLEARLKEAFEIKRSKEDRAKEQRDREFEKTMTEKAREYERKLWRTRGWFTVIGAIIAEGIRLLIKLLAK